MSQVHLSKLYEIELKKFKKQYQNPNSDIENDKSEMTIDRKRDYKIYKSCLFTAYNNDLINIEREYLLMSYQSIDSFKRIRAFPRRINQLFHPALKTFKF
jgi:spore coat polysaccharide biosynthesis protein SpsF (cytidylyltransferase family)